MDEERDRAPECGQEKFMHYQKKVYDGNQRLGRADLGDFSENSEQSTTSSPVMGTSSACYEENDMLVAGGIAAQVKRFGSPGKITYNRQYVEFLINKINELEDSLNNRDLIVNTLQRELELSRDMSLVDASAGPITTGSSSETDSKLLDSNNHVSQAKMTETFIVKLREKDKEIEKLRRELTDPMHVNTPTFSFGDAGPDNQRNKIAVLECQLKEQAITIEQLNMELVRKKKLIQKKTDEFIKQSGKSSNDIKSLMRKIEEMGRELQNKDIDLRQTREELVRVRAEMEENFGIHLAYIKDQLKICHSEEKDRLNLIHDDMMMRYMKAHETEIACYKKQIDSLNNRIKELSTSDCELDSELTACRLAHEAQISSYKECVESLMEEIAAEKEKSETHHKAQLEKYKIELENYRHQVANFDQMLNEEVHKVEDKYLKQLEKYRQECEAQFVVYKCCAESLRQKEKLVEEDIASVNAHMQDVAVLECKFNNQCEEFRKEIETLNNEIKRLNTDLKEAENNQANTLEMYNTCKKDFDDQNEKYDFLQEKFEKKQSDEEMLLNELKKYQGVMDEYESKINEYNRKFQDDLTQVESKHATVVNTFQEQIDNLISTLDEAKQQHDLCLQKCMKQQQQIESVEKVAECDLDAVCDKIKEHKSCKDEINSLTVQLNMASNSIREYESQLAQVRKCYEDDITIYKNQLEKLKEELNNASSFETTLARQLSNHCYGVKESKDHLKELLLQKDFPVYLLGNSKGLDSQRFGDGSLEKDSDTDTQSYHLRSEIGMSDGEEQRYEEVDNLIKPKCNISIQPSPSSSLEKRLVEQALLNELQKELDDCKIENSKKEDLMEKFMKANNELADHCKSLEVQFNDLKNYTNERVEEVESLRNEKESFLNLKTQLESDQLFLISKIESLSEELSNRNAEVESLPEHLDYNLDSGERQPIMYNVRRLFKNVATSTPNLVDEVDKQEDVITPKRKLEGQIQPSTTLGRWINRCNALENENIGLKKDISTLTVKLKEMEYCSEVVKNEIIVFQENCQDLENRLVALESEKKIVYELEQMNEQLNLRNEKLEDARHILHSNIANLKEENVNLERQCNEMRTKLLTETENGEQIGNEALESLVMELNKKSEEVLMVKEDLNLKHEAIIGLENELDKLMEIRAGMKAKLDLVIEDLKKSEEELVTLRQERMNVGLEKRILEKKLVVVRSQNEQLMSEFGERMQSDTSSNVVSVVEELEKELVDLHRKLAAERGVIERMAIEKSVIRDGVHANEEGSGDKRSLLLETYKELENEKERLKEKTNELQEIINKYMEGNEIDKNWQLTVKESQKKLLMELEDYGKRNEHFEGTLMETEELKSMVNRMEQSLLKKSKEKCEVEQLLAEETQALANAVNKIKYLEQQLYDKIEVLQAVGTEKEQLQNNLWSLQEKLCNMEERLQQQKLVLEGEIQERDLRVRHAQLELRACQVLDTHSLPNRLIFNSGSEQSQEVELVTRMQKEVEKEHDLAISRLKRLYFNQMQNGLENAAADMLAVEQRHQSQMKCLEEELNEKANQLREIRKKAVLDVFCSGDKDLNALVADKDKQDEELRNMEKKLDTNGLLVYSLLKSSFETYMQIHIAHTVSVLKKEHKSEMEDTVTRLREEHKRETLLLASKLNMEKLKEISAKEKNLEKMYKDEINSLQWILNTEGQHETSVKARSKIILDRLLRTVKFEYSYKFKNFIQAWHSKYGESLSYLQKELTSCEVDKSEENMPSIDCTQFNIAKKSDIEDILTFKEKILNSSEEFHSYITNFYKTSLVELEHVLQRTHDKVISTVDELKMQLNEGTVIASLEEKMNRLNEEKEKLELGHKSAIQLLLKDHDVELSVVKALLCEFQPCTEQCTDPAALTKVQAELQAKYEKQFEEQRIYYEKKVAEAEKNYSDGVLSQRSRRFSGCSSSSGSDLNNDVSLPGVQVAVSAVPALSKDEAKIQQVISQGNLEEHTATKVEIDYHEEKLFTNRAESIASSKELYLDNISEDGADFNVEYPDMVLKETIENQNALKELEVKYETLIQKLKMEVQEQKDSTNKIMENHELALANLKSKFLTDQEYTLNNTVKEFENKIKVLQETEQKLKSVIQEHVNKLEMLKKEIEYQEDLKSSSTANDCENRLSALRKTLKTEEESRILKIIEEYEEKLKALENELSEKEQLYILKVNLESKLAMLEDEKSVLEEKIKLVVDSLDHCEKDVEILRNKNEEYEKQIGGNSCEEMVKKNEIIKNCENTINNMGETLKILEEEKSKYLQQLEVLDLESKEKTNSLKKYENQFNNMHEIIKNLEEEKKAYLLQMEHELRSELEKKDKYLSEDWQKHMKLLSENHSIEGKVKEIVDEVKLSYESELERLRFQNDKHYKNEIEKLKNDFVASHENERKQLIDNLTRQHKNEMDEVTRKYENKIKIEIENFTTQMERQDQEHVWKAAKAEERHHKEMDEVKKGCEERLIEQLADLVSQNALKKMEMENEQQNVIDKIELENQRKLELLADDVRWQCKRKLEEERTSMLNEFCQLDSLLRTEIEDEKAKFIDEQGKWRTEFEKEIQDKHDCELSELKKIYEEEIEMIKAQASSKGSSGLCDQEALAEQTRIQVLSDLEQQIKVFLAEGDEAVFKSNWPPEMATLERRFTAKYQQQLTTLVQEHNVELTSMKTEYENKIQLLIENCTCEASQVIANAFNGEMSEDGALHKLIKERDCLRRMTQTLRGIVSELAKYLMTCEDELNNTLIGELVKIESSHVENDRVVIVDVTNINDSDVGEENNCMTVQTPERAKRVHFAPDVSNIIDEDSLLDYLDRNHDLSTDIRNELESCLERLKLEAAAVLGLTALRSKDTSRSVESRRLASVTRQLIEKNKEYEDLSKQLEDARDTITKFEQDLADVQADLATEKTQREKERAAAVADAVFGEKEVPTLGLEMRLQNLSQLQERARLIVSQGSDVVLPPQIVTMVEEMCHQVDEFLEEARLGREDLQSQVEAADKQLRSTREFLDEQAAEREFERDEFSREIAQLKEQLQDKGRDWMTRERFASEWSAFGNGFSESEERTVRKVEALEQQVLETTNLLKETQEKKDEIACELKDAIHKVWVLREVIKDLEGQVTSKSEREATLEQRLDELESELDAQNKAQNAMVLELEAMQDGSNRDANLKQLEEHFKKQCNPAVLKQMRSQLREMAKSIQKQTKEMEGLNVHVSSASLSSPSEDISIREQLDSFRCGSETPEGCQSPASLPLEELTLLQDQLHRHTKIEELTTKRIHDQEMQLTNLRNRYEDVQAERDVLQEKCDKQLATLATTQTRLDDVRRKAEWEQAKTDALSMEKIGNLEEELFALQNSLKQKEREASTTHQQVNNLQKIIAAKESELCTYVDTQNGQIEFLQRELKVMETEKKKLQVMLAKCRDGQSVSLPVLMEEILADKNADIEQLEQKVKELQAVQTNSSFVEMRSSERVSNSNSKGYRVSFADEVDSSNMKDDERTRDAEHILSAIPRFSPFFSSTINKNEKPSEPLRASPLLETGLSDSGGEKSKAGGDYTPNWSKLAPPSDDIIVNEELKMEIDQLKQELENKNYQLQQFEERLKDMPVLENELKHARDELASTISEVADDKTYYQEQLEIMSRSQKKLVERENEIQELKDTLACKEENLVRVTADVKAMQLILDKLQKKIQDAKESAVSDDSKRLSIEVQNLKEENVSLAQEVIILKKELDKVPIAEMSILKQSLEDEKLVTVKLRNELRIVEKEKDNVISELDDSKYALESIKSELENALSKLLENEEEISKLQTDLKSSEDSNMNLNVKLQEMNQELDIISRKATQEMNNRFKKDSEDIIKMKDELEQLRSINYDLESDCDKLRTELITVEEKIKVDAKITENESKIIELEKKVNELERAREILAGENDGNNQRYKIEKERCENLIAAAESYKTSETVAQEKALKEKEGRMNAEKKSQFIKREYDKLRRARKELEKKNIVLKDELEKEKRHTLALEHGSIRVHKSLEGLSISPVDTIEIEPIDNRIGGSLDDLAGQLQRELDTSAQLDDTLLSTLDHHPSSRSSLPTEPLLSILHKLIQQGFQSLTSEETNTLHEETSLRAQSRSSPRLADLMNRISSLTSVVQKQKQSVENLHEQLNNERLNYSREKERVLALETETERLQKIISYQEERLTSLSVTIEENRKYTSDLEISVLKEKGNFKKLHMLLETEREKVKHIQKEDTQLIEDLRICLEEEKDSKVRLQLCLEQERERLQTLEAQLNAVRAAEQFMTESSSETGQLNKCLNELKEKYTEIGVELEREKRHVGSLSAALNKEKAECEKLHSALYSKSTENINLRAEVDELKQQINEEKQKKSESEEKIKTIQEAEIRRQRSRATAEERHRKALERAKSQKRELEAEVTRLRRQLMDDKDEEVLVSRWQNDVASVPLISQIKDVNNELEKLVKEKEQLTMTVAALSEKNKQQEIIISQSADQHSNEKEAQYFMSLYLRGKSHRKALVWQKRYLMLSLQCYQDQDEKLRMKISSNLQNKSWVPPPPTASKLTFKHVVLVVVAVTRMRTIMKTRRKALGLNSKALSPKRERLIRQKYKSFSPRESPMGLPSFSPPLIEIGETFSQASARSETRRNEVLLKPTRLADYLETFNELQSRLSQALSPPNRDIGLESKLIPRVLQ